MIDILRRLLGVLIADRLLAAWIHAAWDSPKGRGLNILCRLMGWPMIHNSRFSGLCLMLVVHPRLGGVWETHDAPFSGSHMDILQKSVQPASFTLIFQRIWGMTGVGQEFQRALNRPDIQAQIHGLDNGFSIFVPSSVWVTGHERLEMARRMVGRSSSSGQILHLPGLTHTLFDDTTLFYVVFRQGSRAFVLYAGSTILSRFLDDTLSWADVLRIDHSTQSRDTFPVAFLSGL